jgi:hypothetical protein
MRIDHIARTRGKVGSGGKHVGQVRGAILYAVHIKEHRAGDVQLQILRARHAARYREVEACIHHAQGGAGARAQGRCQPGRRDEQLRHSLAFCFFEMSFLGFRCIWALAQRGEDCTLIKFLAKKKERDIAGSWPRIESREPFRRMSVPGLHCTEHSHRPNKAASDRDQRMNMKVRMETWPRSQTQVESRRRKNTVGASTQQQRATSTHSSRHSNRHTRPFTRSHKHNKRSFQRERRDLRMVGP